VHRRIGQAFELLPLDIGDQVAEVVHGDHDAADGIAIERFVAVWKSSSRKEISLMPPWHIPCVSFACVRVSTFLTRCSMRG